MLSWTELTSTALFHEREANRLMQHHEPNYQKIVSLYFNAAQFWNQAEVENEAERCMQLAAQAFDKAGKITTEEKKPASPPPPPRHQFFSRRLRRQKGVVV